MNIDNLSEQYYNYSPYTYTANNPIYYTDPDGQRIVIHYTVTNEDGEEENKEHIYEFGGSYDGDNQFIKDVYTSLNNILDNNADVTGVIKYLSGEDVGDVGIIKNTKKSNPLIKDSKYQTYHNNETNNIIYDPYQAGKFSNYNGFWSGIFGDEYERGVVSPSEALLHELGHAKSSLENNEQHEKDRDPQTGRTFDAYSLRSEKKVIQNIEQPASRKLGRKVVRKGHYGTFYKTVSPTSTKKAKTKNK